MEESKQKDESQVFLQLGGKVDEATVTLRLFGDDLDPDEVTHILNCLPTKAFKKGHIVTTTIRPRKIKTGQWFLTIERNSYQTLEEQIFDLFEKLPKNLDVWKKLSERFDVSIYCGAWLNGWNRDIFFSSKLLKEMSHRNIEIGIAIYCDCDDEEVKVPTDELNKAEK